MADGSVNIDIKLEDAKAKAEASKAGKDISKNLESGLKGASTAAKNSESQIKSAMDSAASASKSAFTSVGGAAEKGFAGVGDAASNASTEASEAFNKVGKSAQESFSEVGNEANEMGENVEEAAEKGGNSLLKMAKNALKAVVAIETIKKAAEFLKSSLDAFASYEQLEGGVQTLFGAGGATSVEEYAQSVGKSVEEVKGKYEELKTAESMVFENAKSAFKDAGVSMNTYMEQATSFSASLISSLGGDTVKAAEYANTAIVDMSDNANKMGTDIERIQDAYQGFAKQNYTMLDNLKLGYGGTKTEMERLIADANKLKEANGEAANLTIDSYADVIEAIHLVQEEMGITGTTMQEATETIEGSINMAKAAYENWIVGLADDNADIEELTTQLFDSIAIAAGNIIPRLVIILDTLARTLVNLIPNAVSELSSSIGGVLGDLLNSIINIIPSLIEAVIMLADQLAVTIIGAIPRLFEQIVTTIVNELPTIVEVLSDLVTDIADALAQMLPLLVTAVSNIISQIADMLPDLLVTILGAISSLIPSIIQAVIDIVLAIVQALPTIIQSLIQALPQMIAMIVNALITSLPLLIQGLIQMIVALTAALPQIIQALIEAMPTVIISIVSALIDNMPLLIDGFIQLFMAFVMAMPMIIGNILMALPQILMSILQNIGTWGDQLKQAAVNAFNKFVEGVKQKAQEIFNEVAAIPGKILGALGNLGNLLWGAGQSIIDGFLGGLKAAWSNVTGFISGIGDWIAAHKGPKEYDLKLLVPAGNWIIEGLQDGFEQAMPKLERTLNNITGRVESGFDIEVNADSWDNAIDTGEGIARGIVLGYEKVDPAGQMVASMGALMAMAASSNVTNNNVNKTFNFNQPVQTPDEWARYMARIDHHGLAGSYV